MIKKTLKALSIFMGGYDMSPVTIDALGALPAKNPVRLDPASVDVVRYPEHGTIRVDREVGTITYIPMEGYRGPDRFSYTIKDLKGSVNNIGNASVHQLRKNLCINITKSVLTVASDIVVGKPLDLAIAVTNIGTITGMDLQIADVLAEGLGGKNVVLVSKVGRATYDQHDKCLRWQIDELKPGATVLLNVRAEVLSKRAGSNEYISTYG